MEKLPFNIRPVPLGTHRTWDENYVKCCVEFMRPNISWSCITKLTAAVLNAKVPEKGGIYVFIRRSAMEDLFPFPRLPQVVYVGRTKNLQSRLRDYLLDRRAVELRANQRRAVRPAIARMFAVFKDNLEIYYFECSESRQVVYEDILIKLLDPVFNEEQKYSVEIPESDKPIAGVLIESQPAYGQQKPHSPTPGPMLAKLSDAQPAF